MRHQSTRQYHREASTFYESDDERFRIRKEEKEANCQDENQGLPLSHWHTTPSNFRSRQATDGLRLMQPLYDQLRVQGHCVRANIASQQPGFPLRD